jgi:hypothetical protein
VNKKARTAATSLGLTILLTVLWIYLRMLLAAPTNVVALNFFFDTLLFCGAILLLANSIDITSDGADLVLNHPLGADCGVRHNARPAIQGRVNSVLLFDSGCNELTTFLRRDIDHTGLRGKGLEMVATASSFMSPNVPLPEECIALQMRLTTRNTLVR